MRARTLEWSPSFSVGVPELDAQHRELFHRAALVVEGAGAGSRQESAARLRYLHLLAEAHFLAEERLLDAAGFEDGALLRRQHQQFLGELLALVELADAPSGRALQPGRVAGWLGRALVEHVGEAGRALGRRHSGLGGASEHRS